MSMPELQPTERFSDRAADYVRYRPTYPRAAIDAVLAGLGDPARVRAADVGAGTGISARLLAERGVRVSAVEPNAEMRASAEAHPLVTFGDGVAEATGLAAQSFDLLLCAQAFHWFDAPAALREFHRVLAPGARLVLMWNVRDVRDPFTASYRSAILEVGGESSVERTPFDARVISAAGLFTPARLQECEHVQALDRDGLLGRARSASYVPKAGAAGARLVELLSELHARFSDARGLVTLRYTTRVYASERG